MSLMSAYSRLPISFTKGSGIQLWDSNGLEYIDAISGIGVTGLGHCHPAISEVISDQSKLLMHTSNLVEITWQTKLGKMLSTLCGMEKSFICNSGCEANEAALKIARLYGRKKGIIKPVVIVMDGSFHGRTLVTNAASGNHSSEIGFEYEPLVSGFIRVAFDDVATVRNFGEVRDDIAAIMVEPVQGEGGVRIPSAGYLRELRRICDDNGWLLILDEIQTGLCRTGNWFAFQYDNITPDVLTLAKALGNGFPIGACIANGEAAKMIAPGGHGTTFGGNPLACRVACTVLEIMQNTSLNLSAKLTGYLMLNELQEKLTGSSKVKQIRGLGLMIGIEMVDPCTPLVKKALYEQNILINVTRNNVIRLLPSLTISNDDAIEICRRVIKLIN